MKSRCAHQTNDPPGPLFSHYVTKGTDVFINFSRHLEGALASKTLSRMSLFCSELSEWIRILISLATDHQFDKVLEDPVNHVTKLLISTKPGICNLDSKTLESINERFICKKNLLIQRIFPMASIYGFVNLTDRNLYFQEICGSGSGKTHRASLASFRKVLKRRYELAYGAIEIETPKENFYFNFKDPGDRNDFYNAIVKHVRPNCLTEKRLQQVTELWKNRMMSNFDYLMNINYIAQRSLTDFTQYPVMPWLLTEFESSEIDVEDPRVYRCADQGPR